MMRCFYFCLMLVFFVACDDGDVLTVDLDFSQDLERCENFEDFHLIYDTRDDPSEALILVFSKNSENNELFLIPTPSDEPVRIDLSNSNNRFLYRTYNRAIEGDELCEIIPPASLTILENYEADSGGVIVTTTIIDDDNDGIPSEIEGISGEPDAFGRFMDSPDFDGDGLPDYLDADDDNDNVLTMFEIDKANADGDDDPTTTPLDTDEDGNPDYQDEDDDGDNIPTRLEDVDGDQNPRGDDDDEVVDEEGMDVFRYLYNHPSAMEPFEDPGERITVYERVVTTRFTITDIDLDILRSTVVNFGTLVGPTLEILPEIFIEDED